MQHVQQQRQQNIRAGKTQERRKEEREKERDLVHQKHAALQKGQALVEALQTRKHVRLSHQVPEGIIQTPEVQVKALRVLCT